VQNTTGPVGKASRLTSSAANFPLEQGKPQGPATAPQIEKTIFCVTIYNNINKRNFFLQPYGRHPQNTAEEAKANL
jgi:hypothetical protein